MRSPVYSRHRLGRWAAVAMLCLLAQLVGALHMGLVRHARCAAHGELIDADAADAIAGAVDVDPPVGQAALVEHQQRGEHDHEHCQVTSQRVELGAAAIVAVAPAPIVQAVAPPIARSTPATRTLYRLAPKASPPRHG